MSRRIPDYPDAYAGGNHIASIGPFISFLAVFFFIVYDMFVGGAMSLKYSPRDT